MKDIQEYGIQYARNQETNVVAIQTRGGSNKYPQHMFLGVSKKKSILLPIFLLFVWVFYMHCFRKDKNKYFYEDL